LNWSKELLDRLRTSKDPSLITADAFADLMQSLATVGEQLQKFVFVQKQPVKYTTCDWAVTLVMTVCGTVQRLIGRLTIGKRVFVSVGL